MRIQIDTIPAGSPQARSRVMITKGTHSKFIVDLRRGSCTSSITYCFATSIGKSEKRELVSADLYPAQSVTVVESVLVNVVVST